VEEWVAVEEAIVGGLVHHLLPVFLEQHLDAFQFEWIEDDLSMKKNDMAPARVTSERGIFSKGLSFSENRIHEIFG
jgi:hypothetical protein